MIKVIKKYLLYFVLITSIFFLIINNLELNFQSLSIILSLYCLILVSFINYIYNFKTFSYLPIFPLINIYFLICYLGFFFLDKYSLIDINNSLIKINDLDYSIKILFSGYISITLGYHLFLISTKKFQRRGFDFFNLEDKEILIIGILLTSLNIIFFYILKIQFLISSLSQLKYPILLTGIGLLTLFVVLNQKKGINFKNIFCIILISIPLILEILTGTLAFPFMVIFMIFVFVSYLNKKFFIVPILIIALAFSFFHLGKYELRNLSSNKIFVGSEYNKIQIFINVYKNVFKDSIEKFQKKISCNKQIQDNSIDNKDCNFDRDLRLEKRVLHSFFSLLHVTKLTKEDADSEKKLLGRYKYVPYWNGYSYKILYSKLIPRVFWENKPSDDLGNEFGHRYFILTKENTKDKLIHDTNTSWNMPILNEFYVNFGNEGVLYGMFLMGLLFGLIVKMGTIQNKKNLEVIIFFFLFTPLFFMESHFSLLFGAIIQSYLFLMLSCYILLIILRKYY
tara:strand:+ start:2354 stop:3880 length:1527 start_codon:yes stop_codon:yes gene_type:complete